MGKTDHSKSDMGICPYRFPFGFWAKDIQAWNNFFPVDDNSCDDGEKEKENYSLNVAALEAYRKQGEKPNQSSTKEEEGRHDLHVAELQEILENISRINLPWIIIPQSCFWNYL